MDGRRHAPPHPRGRRSGRLRRTPLIYGERGNDYIVVASNGGQPNHPGWYLNLLDEPEVHIQVGTEHMDARAHITSGDERAELWSLMIGIWPDYERYAKRTEREIAVVVIQPID